MRPEHTSRYWLRSKELRVAAHNWPSRRGGVYAYEASEASAEILTSRIGQEGPDSIVVECCDLTIIKGKIYFFFILWETVRHTS